MEKYTHIINHYESCLEKYGDTHKGVDWPNVDDMYNRYRVMLELQKFDPNPGKGKSSLLDFGCGTAGMLEFMNDNNYAGIEYSGLDISQKFIDVCLAKFSGTKFYCTDILKEQSLFEPVDYIVMNGVFTEKRDLSFDDMCSYFTQMLEKLFPLAKRGIAFNTMSKAVDWEREDLFHLPIDLLASFLTRKLSRHFIVRNDYGLYEYTTYVYH
ncbi:MAG: class I SAM-dependent methyltransferase [Sphingobacteriales bacterium]|nr:MAG: class I SAM-dependent methyltransferase [Sphingobacteriales bacterium]